MNNRPIVALGLNPAWQKTLFFRQFLPGEVNRAEEVTVFASGKGINFCRASAIWQQPTRLLQFVGGWTGEQIVREIEAEHMAHCSIPSAAPTRTCNTCLCRASGMMTELIEPSGAIAAGELETLRRAIAAALEDAVGLAICGTYPPGVEEDLYIEAVRRASARKLPVMVDSWRGVDRLIRQEPFDLLKINVEELGKITGTESPKDALLYCRNHFPSRCYAITDGPGAAWFCDAHTMWRYRLPRITAVNPVGAGDTVAAVMFAELLRSQSPAEAFAMGLAAATASCLEVKCAVYDPSRVMDMRREISMEAVSCG